MNEEQVTVHACVLLAAPAGENDKRLVLLSKELGKITVFARGAKRPKSAFLAASNPFVFGEFQLKPQTNAYSLLKANVSEYFRELSADYEAFSYGSYFLEFASYYSEENLDGTNELSLLFYSLKALLSSNFDNRLVRRAFEMKTFVLDGAYPDPDRERLSETARHAFAHIIGCDLKNLYSFTVKEEVILEMGKVIDRYIAGNIPKEFRSLKLLN